MSGYVYNAADINAELQRHSGGIPGLPDLWKPTSNKMYDIRCAPGYKAGMKLPFEPKRIHRHLFPGGNYNQPPVCPYDAYNEPCAACSFSKQYKDDPHLGARSKEIYAGTMAWWQVLVNGEIEAGWRPWKLGPKDIKMILMTLSVYPQLTDFDQGLWVKCSFDKAGDKGQFCNMVSFTATPQPAPLPPQFRQILNLDVAWKYVSAAEVNAAIAASGVQPQQSAGGSLPMPGGGSLPLPGNPGLPPGVTPGGPAPQYPTGAPVNPAGFGPPTGYQMTAPPPMGGPAPQQGYGALPPPPAPPGAPPPQGWAQPAAYPQQGFGQPAPQQYQPQGFAPGSYAPTPGPVAPPPQQSAYQPQPQQSAYQPTQAVPQYPPQQPGFAPTGFAAPAAPCFPSPQPGFAPGQPAPQFGPGAYMPQQPTGAPTGGHAPAGQMPESALAGVDAELAKMRAAMGQGGQGGPPPQ